MFTIHRPRPYYYLTLALGLILLSACSGNSLPTLMLTKSQPKDSIAILNLLGDSLYSHSDTLHFTADKLELQPDTNLYKYAYLSFGRGDSLRYYRLSAGEWVEAKPIIQADTMPKHFPDFYAADVERKYQSLASLTQGKMIAISFARLDNTMPSKRSLKVLDSLYKKDSLRHIYMYLAPSDSLVKSRMKRDSIKGIAFSDTLGEVSRLRKALGIARSTKTHTLVVDSTLRIVKRQ